MAKRILTKAPKGFTKVKGVTTNPRGFELFSNNKSRFGGQRKSVLIKIKRKK